MNDVLPELIQFNYSHYNEKARWALDYLRVPHTRTSLLPGPHMPRMKKLTGRTEVPVLRVAGQVISGSAQIIDYLENNGSGSSLYPANAAQRKAAMAVAQWFDEEVGGPARCAFFYDVLKDHAYMARLFTWGQQERLAVRMYRASFAGVHMALKRIYALTPANAERGVHVIETAMERIVRETSDTGYLVGDQFSVADLTAASLLSICVFPPEYHIPLIEPVAPGMHAWLGRWATHPASEWIRRMYTEHRGASAEVAP